VYEVDIVGMGFIGCRRWEMYIRGLGSNYVSGDGGNGLYGHETE